MILSNLNIIRGFRAGNKISRFLRHILEKTNIKALVGGNLALFVMISGIAGPGAGVLAQTEPELTAIIAMAPDPVLTEVAIQYPTKPVILNQGFNILHWGIDLDGVTGDAIRPIMKGRVARVEYSRFAYGNSILIEHEGGLESFYAHLSQINAREGDLVETRDVIGKMGSTGRSTGDHLHLEVYKNGRPINPLSILPRR